MERSEYLTMAAVEASHWWYGGMRAIVRAVLDGVLEPAQAHRILDAGCGTGGNLAALARYGSVTGIDIAGVALEHARTAGAPLARASVLALPFADHAFDLVTSFEVLYHRAVPIEGIALAEVRRVLRPGGWLVLRLPAFGWLRGRHDVAVHGRRRYTIADAGRMLAGAGLSLERWSYVNALLLPLALAQRLGERWRAAPAAAQSDLTLPPQPINALLRRVLLGEAAWLARGGRFPVGVSLLCLARRGAVGAADPKGAR